MPNHVTNIITILDMGGTDEATIRSKFLNDKNQVDFNVILPMPECLQDFEPHMGIVGTALAKVNADVSSNPLIASLELSNRKRDLENYENMSEEDKADVQRAIDNYYETGFAYWYDWHNHYWGTKWNAYSQPEEGFPEGTMEFDFETAWSHPDRLIRIISQQLPEVTFKIRYADEDTGSNCGRYIIKNDTYLSTDIAPSWQDMTQEEKRHYTEFAFKLRHPDANPREWGYNENWEYDEKVEEEYYAEQEA